MPLIPSKPKPRRVRAEELESDIATTAVVTRGARITAEMVAEA
jgi:hypothetical protein